MEKRKDEESKIGASRGEEGPVDSADVNMTGHSQIEPLKDDLKAHEYDSLRGELLGAERYVIERPLAIVALAAAGVAKVIDKPGQLWLQVALLMTVFFLALINFLFTVEKIRASSRIAAYIQLVLEPSSKYKWVGWETSLREYRIWSGKHKAGAGIEPETKQVADIPLSYPSVYVFHAAIMSFAILAGIWLVQRNSAGQRMHWLLAGIAVAATVIVGIFGYFSPRGRLRFSIERERAKWDAVFTSMNATTGNAAEKAAMTLESGSAKPI